MLGGVECFLPGQRTKETIPSSALDRHKSARWPVRFTSARVLQPRALSPSYGVLPLHAIILRENIPSFSHPIFLEPCESYLACPPATIRMPELEDQQRPDNVKSQCRIPPATTAVPLRQLRRCLCERGHSYTNQISELWPSFLAILYAFACGREGPQRPAESFWLPPRCW